MQPVTNCTAPKLVRLSAVEQDPIIAIGLLTKRDVDRLGPTFQRIYPVDETPCFGDLLAAIDEAEREVWRDPDSAGDLLPPAPTVTASAGRRHSPG
jgi:hypothetical protein